MASNKTTCSLEGDRVVIKRTKGDQLSISFERTIRVPDTKKLSNLPPTLGSFPLYKIQDYASKLPAEMVKKGGLFMPVYREFSIRCIKYSLTTHRARSLVD